MSVARADREHLIYRRCLLIFTVANASLIALVLVTTSSVRSQQKSNSSVLAHTSLGQFRCSKATALRPRDPTVIVEVGRADGLPRGERQADARTPHPSQSQPLHGGQDSPGRPNTLERRMRRNRKRFCRTMSRFCMKVSCCTRTRTKFAPLASLLVVLPSMFVSASVVFFAGDLGALGGVFVLFTMSFLGLIGVEGFFDPDLLPAIAP